MYFPAIRLPPAHPARGLPATRPTCCLASRPLITLQPGRQVTWLPCRPALRPSSHEAQVPVWPSGLWLPSNSAAVLTIYLAI